MKRTLAHAEADLAAQTRRVQVLDAMLREAVAREFAARMGAP